MRRFAAMVMWPAVLVSAVHAQGFQTFNQSSLARAAPLPVLGQATVLPAGVVQSDVLLNASNEYFAGSSASEELTLDSETQRLALRYQRGLGRGLEWSLELPLLFTGGGVQDGLIESWHSAFGLPNGGREAAPQNRYRIRYVRDGETLLDLQNGNSGLGDVRLGAAWGIAPHWALRGLLQLPTGSKQQLTGGHAGAALWTDYQMALADSVRVSLTLSGGAALAATAGPLSDQQQSLVMLGGAVLTVPIYGALDGVVQINAHSKLYKGSGLAPLARAAAPLAFGLRWPQRGVVIDLAIIEDASVNASPDFGVLLGLRWTSD